METKQLTLNQKLSLIQKEFKANKSKFNLENITLEVLKIY